MPHYVGLDVSKRTTSICVIDQDGAIVKEGVVESDPKAIVGFLRGQGRRYRRIGMEAWVLGPTLYLGLAKAGLPIICIETWHASRILEAARTNKTDKNDARGIAEIMRIKAYKSVHIKTLESRQILSLLSARKLLSEQVRKIESHINFALLGFGVKYRRGKNYTFGRRVREATGATDFLPSVIEPLLALHEKARTTVDALTAKLTALAQADPVCRRLMTAPGVGPLIALTYRATIDEPGRFRRSRDVGAHLGLTPTTDQSGKRDSRGRISRAGDAAARTALYMAATCSLRVSTKPSDLKAWGLTIAAKVGKGMATVAVARKLAVILHRMWLSETDFRLTSAA